MPGVASKAPPSYGNIGTGQNRRCQPFGSAIYIGVSSLNHDCHVCVGLKEKFGTCEYMHQANPSRCTCWMTAKPKVKKNIQTVLKTDSTDRARLRYWRQWSRTTGVELGLTVLPASTSTLSFAGEMSAQQTSLPVAAVAEPAETETPRRGSQP